MYYVIKVLISAILIVAISELSKRSSLLGAILASIPLVSVMAFIWLYIDTKNIETISKLSISIFWLVIPSLVLFITLPILLKYVNFYFALIFSIVLTAISYYIMILILENFNFSFFTSYIFPNISVAYFFIFVIFLPTVTGICFL